MPKKTDAEWQELSDFLARKIMGYYTWEDLKALRLEGWQLDASHSDPNPPVVLLWWIVEGEERSYPIIKMQNWQPHKNMTQAIEVRDRIASRGFDWCISRWAGAPQIQALFMRGWEHYDGYADTDAKALCLAIEKVEEANC